jgi:hypothetical protein
MLIVCDTILVVDIPCVLSSRTELAMLLHATGTSRTDSSETHTFCCVSLILLSNQGDSMYAGRTFVFDVKFGVLDEVDWHRLKGALLTYLLLFRLFLYVTAITLAHAARGGVRYIAVEFIRTAFSHPRAAAALWHSEPEDPHNHHPGHDNRRYVPAPCGSIDETHLLSVNSPRSCRMRAR